MGRDQLAPVTVLDQTRLGGLEEVAQHGDEAFGVLQVGKVRGTGEELEPAARNRLVRVAPMRDRDRVVAPSPDDQGGDWAEEVEAVAGADPLAMGVDHRAERLQEGLAGARPLKRLQRSRDRLQVDALPRSALTHPL